ncbi:MAG: NTP transferase domain-containing protein [Deltaproteobacteria bacterium]|nr:NTP transferase domain-containing protein [Deltaproteobacteria bacterium]
MHVIVPMAGHSRRFEAGGLRGPKAMLPVAGRPMIERVLAMFSPDDTFHVVVNVGQLEANPGLPATLLAMAPDVRVTTVPMHDDGPVRSMLAAEGIPDDAPVLVSYCDFLLQWDYPGVLAEWDGEHGAIVTFRGFQPASFGDTLFAHLRVDEDGHLLELREKGCFTDDRTTEHASAGVYGFPRWDDARRLAMRRLANFVPEPPLEECYVSLLMNDLRDEQVPVRVFEAERFACLGTPEDYHQFEGWHRELSVPAPASPEGEGLTLLPLAGRGQRFVDAGFTTPKALIPVRGAPMTVRATASLPRTPQLRFALRADAVEGPLPSALTEAFPHGQTVVIRGETSGQAATCLQALTPDDHDAPLLIASCDYEARYDADAWTAVTEDPSVDVAIWTVRPGDDLFAPWTAYAWCREEHGGVSQLSEKRTISATPRHDPLAIGTFWFRRAGDFVDAATSMIERGTTVGGEHYVGTSINELIEAGKRVVLFEVDRWTCFGTPFELHLLQWWQAWFESSGE